MQEDEDSLEVWAERLTELSTMKTDLSQYIIADDVLLLQEQVEHLHCQWEELCLKVSAAHAHTHSPTPHLTPSSPLLQHRGRGEDPQVLEDLWISSVLGVQSF